MHSKQKCFSGAVLPMVGALLATACADATAPRGPRPTEGVGHVSLSGPARPSTQATFALRGQAGLPTPRAAVYENGSEMGQVPLGGLTLTDREARVLAKRTYRFRIKNPQAVGGYDRIEIRPVSPGAPTAVISLSSGGITRAVVDVEYSRAVSGWTLKSVNSATFDGDGQLLQNGSLDATMSEQAFSASRATRALASVFLPKPAHAASAPNPVAVLSSVLSAAELEDDEEGGCSAEARRVLISVASMVVSGLTNNPVGFFVAGLSFANSLHDWAKCQERQRGSDEEP